jgi:hypothetical protein
MEAIQPVHIVLTLFGLVVGWIIAAVLLSFRVGSWKREQELRNSQLGQELLLARAGFKTTIEQMSAEIAREYAHMKVRVDEVKDNCARKDLMDAVIRELRENYGKLRDVQTAMFGKIDQMREDVGIIKGQLSKEG